MLIALGIGAIVGRASVARRWILAAAFAVFAVLGVAAGWSQPESGVLATPIGIGLAGYLGWRVADGFIKPGIETPTDSIPQDRDRRRFIRGAATAGVALGSGVVASDVPSSSTDRRRCGRT